MGVVSQAWDGGNAGRDPAELRHALGVPIMPKSLERALTHRSYAYENANPPTNERLEFLGDSVLGLVVTDTLFRGYPTLPEGQLAKLRAAVVQMRALAEVARELSLGSYVKLGRGEEVTGGRNKSSILADTLEAIIGAVYIDCGLDEASALVHRLFDPVIAKSAGLGAGLDWKTSLQELTAAQHARGARLPGRGERAGPPEVVPGRGPGRRAGARLRPGPDQEGGRAARGRGGLDHDQRGIGRTAGRAWRRTTQAGRGAAEGPVPGALTACPSYPKSKPSAAAWSTTSPAGPSTPSASCTRAPCAGTWPARPTSRPRWPGAAWTPPSAAASTCGCRWARTPCSRTWA